MASEAAKVVVPESVLRKRKREELWAAEKKTKAVEEKKSSENRKVIFARAKQYAEEYDAQEKELVQLKREARMKGGFYVSPEVKLLFVVRIRGVAARMASPLRPRSSPCHCRCRSRSMWFLLIVLFLLSSARSSLEEGEARALSVGEELVGETMPLRHGRRLYRLAGLRAPAWYEVKISYPASIPSSFSIRLVNDPDAVEDLGSKNRRLLNTEKIIFKADSSKPVYVLVTVEAEGVVAKPNVPDRELALFNIVCDELLLGIPQFAWWVGIAALACIMLASLAPYFLSLHKLLNYEASQLSDADAAKLS